MPISRTRIMYDDLRMQMLLEWNQLAWAVDSPSGDDEAIRLEPVRETVGSG
jgi:hypothetical protein